MVMSTLALNRDCYLLVRAATNQRAAGEVGRRGRFHSLVHGRMDRYRCSHSKLPPVIEISLARSTSPHDAAAKHTSAVGIGHLPAGRSSASGLTKGEAGVGGPDVGLRQPQLFAHDIGSLHQRHTFVERDTA